MAVVLVMVFLLTFLTPLIVQLNAKRKLKKKLHDDVYMFKDFVHNDLFIPKEYTAKDLLKPGITIADDHLLPDFRFVQTSTGLEFFVKAKFVNNYSTDEFEWCNIEEFKAFKSIVEIPLYVVIGIGEYSYLPGKLYLLPYKHTTSNKLRHSAINKYQVTLGQQISF